MYRKTILLSLATGALALASCASSSETASRDSLTAHVGQYDLPPPGTKRVRVGVPDFEVASGVTRDVTTLAADQLTTLGFRTGRFQMIERAQLEQLKKEQNLKGVVREDERAKAGQVRGVDYLFYGKVTNLRVKKEKSATGFNIGSIPIPGTRALRGFDYRNADSTITVDCGVDLRLVDPTSGTLIAADQAEYKRTDRIGAFGISILGVSTNSGADLSIDTDNKGKILRLALDDCLRKMLPAIDQALAARGSK